MAIPILKPSGKKERVWVTGIRRAKQTRGDFQASLEELQKLVDTAGGEVIGITSQEIDPPSARTFVGKGKAQEILEEIQKHRIDSVAVDDELSPTQNQNLEELWGVKVLDRTAVILDIFAKRAHTKEGRLQVELAQLHYIQPRLKGLWSHFSKQTGGIGTKGPGETQLEVDRRHIRERISRLKERLEEVQTHRKIHRIKREAVPLPLFSLVGYTNAGKSTLFNLLTEAGVLVEDKLFATLDPTVRRLKLPSGRQILLADTVGFIRKLPHSVVEAFKATFEEIAYADGLIHVIDASDSEVYQHVETVEKVLTELQLHDKPRITVLNKKDCGDFYSNGFAGIALSAVSGEGVDRLLLHLDDFLRQRSQRARFLLPHARGDILAVLHRLGHMIEVEHTPQGTKVDCEIDQKFVNRYREYLVS